MTFLAILYGVLLVLVLVATLYWLWKARDRKLPDDLTDTFLLFDPKK